MDKFQLPRGRLWRSPCWEGNTVVIISNIHRATIVSRYRVCGILGSIIENTEICAHSAECFPPKQYERMCSGIDSSCKQRETAEISPHQRSAIQMSPRCLNKEERRRRLFCLSAWNGEECFPAFAPTHLTQGRKHGGLTSPGSCGEKRKGGGKKGEKIRRKQWGKKFGVWVLGIHLNTQSRVRSRHTVHWCVWVTSKEQSDPEWWGELVIFCAIWYSTRRQLPVHLQNEIL